MDLSLGIKSALKIVVITIIEQLILKSTQLIQYQETNVKKYQLSF